MFDLDRLLPVARQGRLASSRIHGEQHWKAVTLAGLDLCDVVPEADRVIVFLFGLLHDCRRENEHHDPDHGARAARLVDEVAGDALTLEPPRRLRLLARACRDHTVAGTTADPTLAVCFDADRLNLWRVGITPSVRLLSTTVARRRDRIEPSCLYHQYATRTSWTQLARQATL
jgi:uncharacterized protein